MKKIIAILICIISFSLAVNAQKAVITDVECVDMSYFNDETPTYQEAVKVSLTSEARQELWDSNKTSITFNVAPKNSVFSLFIDLRGPKQITLTRDIPYGTVYFDTTGRCGKHDFRVWEVPIQ